MALRVGRMGDGVVGPQRKGPADRNLRPPAYLRMTHLWWNKESYAQEAMSRRQRMQIPHNGEAAHRRELSPLLRYEIHNERQLLV